MNFRWFDLGVFHTPERVRLARLAKGAAESSFQERSKGAAQFFRLSLSRLGVVFLQVFAFRLGSPFGPDLCESLPRRRPPQLTCIQGHNRNSMDSIREGFE